MNGACRQMKIGFQRQPGPDPETATPRIELLAEFGVRTPQLNRNVHGFQALRREKDAGAWIDDHGGFDARVMDRRPGGILVISKLPAGPEAISLTSGQVAAEVGIAANDDEARVASH